MPKILNIAEATCEELALRRRELETKELPDLRDAESQADKDLSTVKSQFDVAQQELKNAEATYQQVMQQWKAAEPATTHMSNGNPNPAYAKWAKDFGNAKASADTALQGFKNSEQAKRRAWERELAKYEKAKKALDDARAELQAIIAAQSKCSTGWVKKGGGVVVLVAALITGYIGIGKLFPDPPLAPPSDGPAINVSKDGPAKVGPSDQAKEQANQPLGEEPQPSEKAKKQANQPLGDPKDLEGHRTPSTTTPTTQPEDKRATGEKELDGNSAHEHGYESYDGDGGDGGEVHTGDESNSWTYEYHYTDDGEHEPNGGDGDEHHDGGDQHDDGPFQNPEDPR
jgi:hypothetical protein